MNANHVKYIFVILFTYLLVLVLLYDMKEVEPYRYQPLECLLHMSSTEPFMCHNTPMRYGEICGGLLLTRNACIVYKSGLFTYSRPTYRKSKTHVEYCSNIGLDTELGQYGELMNRHCYFDTSHPHTLINIVGGKRILLMGDSHLRNIFMGIQGLIRDLPFLYEKRPSDQSKKEGILYRYRVWRDRDEFVIGVGVDEIQSMLLNVNDNKDYIEFYFVWAPSYEEQSKLMEQYFEVIRPDIFVNSIIGPYEPSPVMDPSWMKSIESVISKYPPRYYVWMAWPFGTEAPSRENIATFLRTLKTTETILVSYETLLVLSKRANLTGIKQYETTRHSMCVMNDNRMEVIENTCIDPFDRAYARFLITLLVKQSLKK